MAINPRARRRRLDRPRLWPGVRSASGSEAARRKARRPPPDPEPQSSRVGRARHGTVADSVPRPDPDPTSALDAAIAAFTACWERGEPVCAEDYLDQVAPEHAAELIYQEFCLAEADHLEPDPNEYLRRFPDQSQALDRLFSLHDALSVGTLRQIVSLNHLPGVGDRIGPYRLLRELGHGAFARVFLAEQADLADRLIVLKVSTRPSAEPTLLARARHAHIVEVLRHTEADDGALHLICLPFLGGATLGAVLKVGRRRTATGRPRLPRSGREFLDDLDRVSAPEYPRTGLPRASRELVARLSYPKTLAWMIARLAEALDHAERRGVTHGDIKPSNILITADSMPMLFDFNLAVDWHLTDALELGADLGGTLAYMAPERLRALGAPVDSPESSAMVRPRRQPDRHRADLYALGLVLAEALTGEPPAIPVRRSDDPRQFASGLARARAESFAQPSHRSRSIPPALRVILTRCLAPDPADRYARGAELAEDLDRWRSNRPLLFAPEPVRSSWVRHLRSYRFPILALALTVAAAGAVGSVAWSVLEGSRRDQAMDKYAYILDQTDGVFRFRRFGDWQPNQDGDPIELATRNLAHYGVADDPFWRDRTDIRMLPERERVELEAWLMEQVLRKAVALGDRPDSPRDWERAINLLDRAGMQRSCLTFRNLRAQLAARFPRTAGPADHAGPDRPVAAAPAWLEAYLGGILAEPLHARDALGRYLDVLKLRPDLFWAHYRAAVVAVRIDEYAVAWKHLQECVARRPGNKALHAQLASVLLKLEADALPGAAPVTLGDAESETNQALDLDPDFAVAHFTRTMIRREAGQADGARDDQDRYSILTSATNPADALVLRSNSNMHYGPNFHQARTAEDEILLRRAAILDPTNQDHRMHLAIRHESVGRVAEALEEYNKILDTNPEHLVARYRRAVVNRQNDYEGTIRTLAEIIKHPRFEETFREQPAMIRACHHLATYLMNQGQLAEAEAVAQRSLVLIHQSNGLQQAMIDVRNNKELAPEAETYYLLARVHARMARSDPERWPVVIEDLRTAFELRPNLRRDWFMGDAHFRDRRDRILAEIAQPVDQ